MELHLHPPPITVMWLYIDLLLILIVPPHLSDNDVCWIMQCQIRGSLLYFVFFSTFFWMPPCMCWKGQMMKNIYIMERKISTAVMPFLYINYYSTCLSASTCILSQHLRIKSSSQLAISDKIMSQDAYRYCSIHCL